MGSMLKSLSCPACGAKLSLFAKIRVSGITPKGCPECGSSLFLSRVGGGLVAFLGFLVGKGLIELGWHWVLAAVAAMLVAAVIAVGFVPLEKVD